jgi:mono/diheme cytochrome c family protein
MSRATRFLKYVGIVLGGLAVLSVSGILVAANVPPSSRPASNETVEASAPRIARGEYLFKHVAQCERCHSPHREDLLGWPVLPGSEGSGLCFPEWVGFPGRVCASNITSHKDDGVGGWSDGELMRAIRENVGRDGRGLFGHHFRGLSDEDTRSVVAYLRTLPPLPGRPGTTELPLVPRLFVNRNPRPLEGPVPQPDPNNRAAYGAYLAEIAGCEDCHSSERGPFSGGIPFELPGGGVQVSRNLTPDPTTGIGTWSEEVFAARFKSERNRPHPPVPAGAPNPVVMPWDVYSGMTDGDLAALHTYLRSLPAIVNDTTAVAVNGAATH